MNPGLSACLILFATTAALSAAITGLAVFVARRRQLLAHPVERSSHSVPTPQVGGVGICLALMVGLMLVPAFSWRFVPAHASIRGLPYSFWLEAFGFLDSRKVLMVVLAQGLVLGLLDDILHLAAGPKFVGQVVMAAMPLIGGIAFVCVDPSWADAFRMWWGRQGQLPPGIWIEGGLTFLWVLFFINAFNFMDGVNGQSGFFTLNTLLWWMVIYGMEIPEWKAIGLYSESGSPALLRFVYLPHVAIAGAVLGFLFWNFPRARTFMGDSGSLPLGAVLAVMAVAAHPATPHRFVASCFPLSLFIYDVLYTLVRRVRRRENLLTAHRSHLYQRLLIATGWSHARLLAFHLPFYLLSGLAGAVYFASILNSRWPRDYPPLGLLHWIPAQGIACLVFLALLLLGYTFLVWRFEEKNREATAS